MIVETGKNVARIKELQDTLEALKVERMNAFIDGDTEKVNELSAQMEAAKAELEGIS